MSTIVTPTTKLIYQDALGDFKDRKEFLWKHRGGFVHFIQNAIRNGKLDQKFSRKHFKLERLSYALNPDRDKLIAADLYDQLLKDDDKFIETPQYCVMRLCMAKSLDQPNPTRAALKLYETLSTNPHIMTIFNNQRLLFDVTKPVREITGSALVPQDYYDHGWTVLDLSIANEFEAIAVQEAFIKSINSSKLPLHKRFAGRIQLAKADQIPVCDDVVASSFQVLHFDMGHPFLGSDHLFVSHVGIYLPHNTKHKITARTRIVELNGVVRHLGMSSEQIEQAVMTYVREHGDGWTNHNTYRLACFARFLDALSEHHELESQTDKTVGQWFQNDTKVTASTAHDQEIAFYSRHNVDLPKLEHQIALKPGQLLILDNTRVIHGRIGNRRSRELFNFMWGIESIGSEDVVAVRKYVGDTIKGDGN